MTLSPLELTFVWLVIAAVVMALLRIIISIFRR
jgi:hypothetical protein